MTERDRVYYEMITVAYPLGAEYQELSGIKRLADAGYRKEEEVQKETIEKLIKSLLSNFKGFDIPLWVSIVKDIAKESFGVEVEE